MSMTVTEAQPFITLLATSLASLRLLKELSLVNAYPQVMAELVAVAADQNRIGISKAS